MTRKASVVDLMQQLRSTLSGAGAGGGAAEPLRSRLPLSPEDFERMVAEVSARIIPEVCRRLRNDLIPTKPGVWMSVRDVMRELHYDTAAAARKWIKRRKVTTVYRGTALLVARRDVETALIKSVNRGPKGTAESAAR
jgi:hypothetical protein